jgi:hypothetical protein
VLIYFSLSATEIQNIQIVDGDLPRGVSVPIYMIFPRLFTCPSLTSSRTYKIEFQLNIVMMMPDGRLLSKKYVVYDFLFYSFFFLSSIQNPILTFLDFL